ncbi:MAG: molybdenum cofactor guanylyltransferase [Bacillota bacterium]
MGRGTCAERCDGRQRPGIEQSPIHVQRVEGLPAVHTLQGATAEQYAAAPNCKVHLIGRAVDIAMSPTLAILAGGQSKRMGFSKATLRIGHTPILEYLLDHFRWLGPTLLVTSPANQHPPGWDCFDREVSDPVSGIGPLRGVVTALEHSSEAHAVLVTVDMPWVRSEQLLWLVESFRRLDDALGLMLIRSGPSTAKIEPFPSIFQTKAAPLLREMLSAGQRSVQGLLRHGGFQSLPAPEAWDERIWTNLNHPTDFEAFLAQWLAHEAGR